MLKIEGIVAGYNNVNVLNDVNFHIKEGQMISFVGANAAGKSTLVNTICGLISPRLGRIIYTGQEITKIKPHERVRMGIVQVPEGRKLFPELTVLENLLVASSFTRAKKSRYEQIQNVYDLFPRLKERESQIANTMSGGEQQMLAIGRALMCKPKLLILDEPSLGLAPLVVSQILEAVKKLKQQGITILLIEQHLKNALENSDYGYVLEHGRITLEGTGVELLRNPKTKQSYLGR